MRFTAYSQGYLRPCYLSNSQDKFQLIFTFSIWENFRIHSWFNKFKPTMFIIFASLALFIFFLFSKKRKIRLPFNALYGTLIFSAIYSFVIPFIANGEPDTSKHLFGFTYLYDLLLCINLALIIKFALWIYHKIHPPKAVRMVRPLKLNPSFTP